MSARTTKAKAVVALVGGVLAPAVVLLQSAVTDDTVTTDEWVKIGIALLVGIGTALGVRQVPNRPVPGQHRVDAQAQSQTASPIRGMYVDPAQTPTTLSTPTTKPAQPPDHPAS